MKYPLILASSSPYRRQLLDKLGLPYTWQSPEIDETPLPDESVAGMTMRLAHLKATTIAKDHPDALIIASDQAADWQGQALGKPGTRQAAINQLTHMSGQTITFHTSLCLMHAASGRNRLVVEPFRVGFRHLSPEQIEHYVDKEKPLDCAGSFRSEGLGIVLFEHFSGRDPNSLIGLPLMALVDLLQDFGMILP